MNLGFGSMEEMGEWQTSLEVALALAQVEAYLYEPNAAAEAAWQAEQAKPLKQLLRAGTLFLSPKGA